MYIRTLDSLVNVKNIISNVMGGSIRRLGVWAFNMFDTFGIFGIFDTFGTFGAFRHRLSESAPLFALLMRNPKDFTEAKIIM